MMTPVILSMMAFLVVFGLIGLLAFVLRDTSPKTSTRLDMLVGKKRKEDVQQESFLKKQAFENDKKSLLEMLTPKFLTPQKFIEQADANVSASTLFGLGLLFGLVGATVTWLTPIPWFFAPVSGATLFCTPFVWLWWKRRARLNKFAAQLPDAMELAARALRAGHALGAGMHVVAEEMPAPIAEEFRRVYEEQNYGIPMEESLRSLADRIPNLDLRFFVTSVNIQRQTGGDLAEILDKIGYVIRERYRILGQVKALTAEGRLSGVVLITLPFALFAFMLHLKPDYVEQLWLDPLGIKMSIGAAILQVVGAICIKKIVDIKV
jgi:tight adherence protein B